jgi:hypothetical protein
MNVKSPPALNVETPVARTASLGSWQKLVKNILILDLNNTAVDMNGRWDFMCYTLFWYE